MPKVDAEAFHDHLARLFEHWESHFSGPWRSSDGLVVLTGETQDDVMFSRSVAIQQWLTGWELVNTVFVFVRGELHVIGSSKVIDALKQAEKVPESMKERARPVFFHVRLRGDNASTYKLITGLLDGTAPDSSSSSSSSSSAAAAAAAAAASSGKEKKPVTKLGLIARQVVKGDFGQGVLSALGAMASVPQVDVSLGWAELLMLKDAKEVRAINAASLISGTVLSKHVLDPMQVVINDDAVTTHLALARRAGAAMDDATKVNPKLDPEVVDQVYPPIVESGGSYAVRHGEESTNKTLHFGSIIVSLGARYKMYCANVARTYLIDASDEQKAAYNCLVAARDALFARLAVTGEAVTMGSCYDAARDKVRELQPDLEKYFTEEAGFGIGLEFQETSFTFKSANMRHVLPGMTFTVAMGLLNVPNSAYDADAPGADPRAATFAVYLADTVVVEASAAKDGTARTVKSFTGNVQWRFKEISYDIVRDEEPSSSSSSSAAAAAAAAASAASATKKKKSGKAEESSGDEEDDSDSDASMDDDETSSSDDDDDDDRSSRRAAAAAAAAGGLRRSSREATVRVTAEKERSDASEHGRADHQKLLLMKLRRTLREQYAGTQKKKEEDDQLKKVPMPVAYKSWGAFPPDARRNRVHVDEQHESVLLPIMGVALPYHVSCIKSATKQDDGYLRINFVTPVGAASRSDALTTQAMLAKAQRDDPHMVFVKEALFRVTDRRRLDDLETRIKRLRAAFLAREREEKENADLVKQAALQLAARGQNMQRLQNVFIRPTIQGTKRTTGDLEAHRNGFRFMSHRRDVHVDILFSNIRHAFFQRAENDYFVILHFHLANPIMIGKKKITDLQFVTEVAEVSQALDARSARYGRDDVEAEQQERLRKKQHNDQFASFCRAVKKRPDFPRNIEFQAPMQALGFNGVPFRSRVDLAPTDWCLVALSEAPFFVVTMADVEVVSLERVDFNIHHFDMVFVPKDYSKNVWQINSIPTENLDIIKRWLDQVGLKYFTGPSNMLWPSIMTEARNDPLKFHEKEGYWGFLEQAVASDDSEDDDEFAEESESYDSEEEDSDDYSDDSGSDSFSDGQGDESGEDWEELEREAERDDRRAVAKRRDKGDIYDSDDERKGGRGGGGKRSGGGGGGGGRRR